MQLLAVSTTLLSVLLLALAGHLASWLLLFAMLLSVVGVCACIGMCSSVLTDQWGRVIVPQCCGCSKSEHRLMCCGSSFMCFALFVAVIVVPIWGVVVWFTFFLVLMIVSAIGRCSTGNPLDRHPSPHAIYNNPISATTGHAWTTSDVVGTRLAAVQPQAPAAAWVPAQAEEPQQQPPPLSIQIVQRDQGDHRAL